ncbi:hypothetical protein ETC05_16570 [Geobacillus sp. BMUD]|uniref:hypothetical protein n=1 Tax=Geobacillus sp. BMUD TaxID=2508876 RepID=UPI0014930DD0|nr:hypothetical protein [Geobacillus sp. BMUD]NNU85353.1 hypothetical protein [Geobacillus sp. BMUD]
MERRKSAVFEYLRHTPYLHSSDYLRELYESANTKAEKNILFNYIKRFEVDDEEYSGYYSLYEQIGRELGRIEDNDECIQISIPKSLLFEYFEWQSERKEDD